jgi:hypothetical protein
MTSARQTFVLRKRAIELPTPAKPARFRPQRLARESAVRQAAPSPKPKSKRSEAVEMVMAVREIVPGE